MLRELEPRSKRPATGSDELSPAPLSGRRWGFAFPFARPARSSTAVLAALVLTVVVWIGFGVSVQDIARFLGYQLLFLLAPGVLLYRALSGRRHSLLREVAIGWPLGHLVEIFAFGLTAWFGLRSLLPVFPALVVAGSLLVTTRRRLGSSGVDGAASSQWRDGRRWSVDVHWAHATAGIFAIALLYLAAAYFAQTPLPTFAGFGGYVPDITFDIDLSSQLLHHWPLTSPQVAGTPLPYELFVYLHIASIAQVTGIQISVVLLRLYLVALLAMFVIELCWAGQRLTGSRWSGPLAAALVLLVGEINPLPSDNVGSGLHPLLAMAYSPTFMLGLVMFIPALVLAAETGRVIPRPAGRREWLVLTLLLLGCAGAKGAVLPVLGGGLVLYAAWRYIRQRRLELQVLKVFALVVFVLGAAYLVIYRGRDEGLHLLGEGTAAGIPRIQHLAHAFGNVPVLSGVSWFFANVVALLMFGSAPLAGLIFVFRGRATRATPTGVLLLATFLSGLLFYFFFFAPGYSQLWFTQYGYLAAAILSAWGFALFYKAWGAGRGRLSSIVGVGLLYGTVGLAITYLAAETRLSRTLDCALWGVIPAALVVCWVALGRHRYRLALLVTLPVIIYGALDVPTRIVSEVFEVGHEPVWVNNWGRVQPELVSALGWVRHNTGIRAVLAVNNAWLDPHTQRAPDYMFYSALSQRSVYLEGWNETVAVLGREALPVITARRALNDAVFQRGDRRALRTMMLQANVGYLLADSVAPYNRAALARLGQLVYANREVAIYRVSRSPTDPGRMRPASRTPRA